MKKYIVTLTKDEREALVALTSKGKHKSQKILNALILLGCDEGGYQMKRSTRLWRCESLKAIPRIPKLLESRYAPLPVHSGLRRLRW